MRSRGMTHAATPLTGSGFSVGARGRRQGEKYAGIKSRPVRDGTKLSVKSFTRGIEMKNYASMALRLLYGSKNMQYREKFQAWRGLALFRMQADTQHPSYYTSKA